MIDDNLYPLSSPQMDIWLASAILGHTSAYHIGGVAQIQGDLDVDIIHEAIEDMIDSCDALRLVLRATGGVPHQQVLPAISTEFDTLFFENDADAWSYMHQKFNEKFELYDKPLWHFDIIEIEDGKYFLFMKFHHLILDGYSFALLIKMFSDSVSRNMTSENYSSNIRISSVASDFNNSYVDFLEKDRAYRSSDAIEADRTFWRDRFAIQPPPLFPAIDPAHAGSKTSDVVNWQLKRSLYEQSNKWASQHLSLIHI